MENYKYRSRLLHIVFVFTIVVSSCTKDNDHDFTYLVSSELAASYSESYINTMLDYVIALYPELAEIGTFINDGVSVYKVAYNTNVFGDKIVASGLVSIPATPGEYPVVSFQNGTNTLHSNCPSEAPSDYYFQLVEFIASMGFVVVIPDYPGFGSCSDIPHPYLIAEPTTESIAEMFRAVNEAGGSVFPGTKIKNEYYLMGYSQGGWATMALHRELEVNYSTEFNLSGSVCGAGPYNLYNLFTGMANVAEYPMPSYLGYIINSYFHYDQFSIQVSEILNEPYASRLPSLYDGTLTLGEINSQLTISIPVLMKQEFITGFQGSPAYSSVRDALRRNSITPWNTQRQVLMVHGDADLDVNVSATETFYSEMLNAGTSASLISKMILPGLNHTGAAVPCMTEGVKFIVGLRDR